MAFAPNSQQRQEIAGTGMGYDAQGNKVETGGGVFGDASAKSESIVKSLEILTIQGIDGLDYDKSLLKVFQKLSDSLTHAAEVIYAIPGLRMGGSDFGTQTGTTSTGPGGFVGGLMDSLGLGGVFGGSTSASSSIESAGIQLRGSLQDFIDGTKDSIMKYKDVVTQFHEDGGWFGSDSDWQTRRREVDKVGTEVQNALRDVFVNAKDVMTELGSKVGAGVDTVNDAFKRINFKGIEGDIDNMGLTGQAALDQLNAVIGQKLDETAKAIFPYFDNFKKFGEGFLQTVIRVQDGNTKVDQALRSMGSSFDVTIDSFTTTTKQFTVDFGMFGKHIFTQTEVVRQSAFDISEALIKGAGGLDNFKSQAEFFTSTFLTESQRLVPVQASVTKQMKLLGLNTDITRAEFAKLVISQDLATVGGRKMYQSLMDLAPGFDMISKAAETALKDTVTKFQDFAKTIHNYLIDLNKGSLSALTPEQKYVEAGALFQDTIAKAITGDKDAISNATSTATALLEASKGFNASSPQYLSDLDSVTSKLKLLESISNDKASVAQQQLDGINNQVDLLSNINKNIAVLVGAPAHATGGYASGWALVGERGPEMVNFSNPAQVYTADQTRGMFSAGQSMNAMVAELQQLRQEIAQLRKEQQQQTGDIIISNYDANQQAATGVSEAVMDSSNNTTWLERSKTTLK
jgi:hypothetical protein